MNEEFWLDVISNRNRHWTASLLRMGLAAASFPYGLVSDARNFGYQFGLFSAHRVGVPVVSIGNITTGGTGKTPTVAWIVHQLQQLGKKPAILSRGYRSLDGEENDEKKLLDSLCPHVPHVQHPKRIESARKVLAETDANVLVLDDAFQHRQVQREVDLVLVDALNPWGFGALLPRGLLRERRNQLARADAILLTRCDLASEKSLQEIIQETRRHSLAPVLKTRFQATDLINGYGETRSLAEIAQQKPLVFCGIGNPTGFQQALSAFTNVTNDRCLTFPDHYHYGPADLERLQQTLLATQSDLYLTTRKDLVKLPQDGISGVPVWALNIELTFIDSPAPLIQLLEGICA
ncbi:tetraacyldisaccharide 4'-kinase [Planctomicrobium sp. SH527]|uniref:tetraacyldisaccharide 4'-kinase n=1 Tax=Planctomicrobium sp. SH527 TaxID=3448123 RepID=UPI003F5AECB1